LSSGSGVRLRPGLPGSVALRRRAVATGQQARRRGGGGRVAEGPTCGAALSGFPPTRQQGQLDARSTRLTERGIVR